MKLKKEYIADFEAFKNIVEGQERCNYCVYLACRSEINRYCALGPKNQGFSDTCRHFKISSQAVDNAFNIIRPDAYTGFSATTKKRIKIGIVFSLIIAFLVSIFLFAIYCLFI